MSHVTPAPIAPPPASGPWGTVRFRRAKRPKSWALLAIPTQIYPVAAHRLFELKARLVEKHEKDAFVSVLFEAPSSVAARLALTFPAPPGCDQLRIASSGDRIVSGTAAKSSNVICQHPDPDETPEPSIEANPA